ncbi:MAG TPA: DUF1697 domain-containing protein [Gemmatimonadaceae bacterium]
MPRYVAFLRAINVGGHTVKMDHLRALFDSLRFGGVETFIASGNVIFDTRSADALALERRIERHLARELGYEVATFLRSPAELATIVGRRVPGGGAARGPEHTLYIGFLKSEATDDVRQRLARLATRTDDFHAHGRELYWRCGTRLSESPISGALLERTVGAPITLRKITTVRTLADRYASPE